MKKLIGLIGWEVVMAVLAIVVITVSFHYGLKPDEIAVAAIVAIAAVFCIATAPPVQLFRPIAALVATFAAGIAAAIAVSVPSAPSTATLVAAFAAGIITIAVIAVFPPLVEPKPKYQWVLLSLIGEGAAVCSAIVYGGRLFVG